MAKETRNCWSYIKRDEYIIVLKMDLPALKCSTADANGARSGHTRRLGKCGRDEIYKTNWNCFLFCSADFSSRGCCRCWCAVSVVRLTSVQMLNRILCFEFFIFLFVSLLRLLGALCASTIPNTERGTVEIDAFLAACL